MTAFIIVIITLSFIAGLILLISDQNVFDGLLALFIAFWGLVNVIANPDPIVYVWTLAVYNGVLGFFNFAMNKERNIAAGFINLILFTWAVVLIALHNHK